MAASYSYSTLLGLALLCSCGLHASAMRVRNSGKEEIPGWLKNKFVAGTVPQDLEATIRDGTFEDIARVRVTEMKLSSPPLAAAAMAMFSDRASGMFAKMAGLPDGISQASWDADGPTIVAFDKVCQLQQYSCMEGQMTFQGFLAARPSSKWQPSNASSELTEGSGEEQVDTWLKEKGYSQGTRTKLAKARKFGKIADLELFVTLDKSHDGLLSLTEVIDYLEPADDSVMEGHAFSMLATVQVDDLTVQGFPKIMAKSIMDTVDTATITKKVWTSSALQKVIADFLHRDKLGPVNGSVDAIDGRLKFYQFADALPNLVKRMDGERNTIVKIGKEDKTIHVPSMKEITGVERLELSVEDLEKWLTSDQKMYNGGHLLGALTGKWSYAKKLATSAMAWADGSMGAAKNGRVARTTDEWPNLAGRLALFLEIDQANDGEVTFEEAYPFLKKIIEEGLPTNELSPEHEANALKDLKHAISLVRSATAPEATPEDKTEALDNLGPTLSDMEVEMKS